MNFRIIKVFPLNIREYTTKDGQKQVWKSKGFLLSDGRNSTYAEAQMACAESLESLAFNGGEVVNAHLHTTAREYESNGMKRYYNEVTIDAMMIITRQ